MGYDLNVTPEKGGKGEMGEGWRGKGENEYHFGHTHTGLRCHDITLFSLKTFLLGGEMSRKSRLLLSTFQILHWESADII